MWLALAVVIVGPLAGGLDAAEEPSRRTPVVGVYQEAKNAVVNIASTRIVELRSPRGIHRFFDELFDLPARRRRYKRKSVGSGFVLHEAGYIVTNAHVVARTAKRSAIFADGSEHAAEIVASDPHADLAVLKIDREKPLEPIELGTSGDLMIGERIVAIGNPLGYQNTVTTGVVSAVGRKLEVNDELAFDNLIQIDAPINPGNSGGPLLNVHGELIGVNTAIRADAQNIGFATPVDRLREILPELLAVRRRQGIVLGLRVGDPTGGGLAVASVSSGTPAARAGVEAGATLRSLDGRRLRRPIDFPLALLGRSPGERIELGWRSAAGEAHSASLVLGERAAPEPDELLAARLGVEVERVSDRMARALGMREPRGLMIEAVRSRSPAGRAGLERGDLLLEIDGRRVTSPADAAKRLRKRESGARARLTVVRVRGQRIFKARVTVELAEKGGRP